MTFHPSAEDWDDEQISPQDHINTKRYNTKVKLIFCPRMSSLHGGGGDNSNKTCFGRKTLLFQETEDFARNWETVIFSGKYYIVLGHLQ